MKLPIIPYIYLAATLLTVLVPESYGQNAATALDLPGGVGGAGGNFAKKTNPVGLPTGAQSRTVEAWIYLPADYRPNTGIFSTWDAGWVNGTAFAIKIQGGQKLYLWTHNNDRTSTGSVPTDQWAHIATIFNSANNTYAFLINGQDAGSGSIGSLNTRVSEVSIGYAYDSYSFKGKIRDTRLWNRALSATEVQQRMNGLVDPQLQVGLVGYWPLSEGAGSVAFDQSPNANHLTLSGSATWQAITPPTAEGPWNLVKTGSYYNVIETTNHTLILPGVDGVYRSTNSGTNWTQISFPSQGRVGVSVGFPGGGAARNSIFVNSLDDGIFLSTDDGATWTATGPVRNSFGTGSYSTAFNGVSVVAGYGGFPRGMYRWTGSSWANTASGWDGNSVIATSNGWFFAEFYAGGGINVSRDNGATWTKVFTEAGRLCDLGGALLAVKLDGVVYSSTDLGTNWTQIATVPNVGGIYGSPTRLSSTSAIFTASGRVSWITRDLGHTWSQIWTNGGHFTVVGSDLWVGTEVGLYRASLGAVLGQPAAPVISIQPTNVTASVGASANFSVTVTGTAPLSYQWVKDGVNVPGATNATLAFTNVQPVNIGSYTAVVTNTAGSVTSSVAALSIPGVNSGLWQGLVAYYPFNGNANDSSGNGNNGVSTTPTLTVDRFGATNRAYNFKNNVNSKIEVAHSASLDVNSSFSVSVWVKFNEPWSFHNEEIIWKSDGSFPSYTGWDLSVNQDNGAYAGHFDLLNPSQKNFLNWPIDFNAQWQSRWQNIVAVRSGQTNSVYINGALVNSAYNGGLSVSSQSSLIIGGSIHPVSGAYNRDIDDVRIYNRALSSNEIVQLYASESVPNGPAPDPAGSAPVATVSVFAGSGVAGNVSGRDLLSIQLNEPNGLGFLSTGVLIVADAGNHQLRLIYPPSLASFGAVPYAASGAAGYADAVDNSQAQMNLPLGLFVGPGDDVFVADTMNNRIRRVSPNGTRTVSTVAGSGGIGLADGPGAAATFNFPNDVVMDSSGNLFVTEFNNHVIRKIAPGGAVSIFAGAGVAGTADGQGTAARFNGPGGIARGPDDTLYVTDYLGNRIRKVTPTGVVTTIAGDGVAGLRDGVGTAARFNNPDGIAVDRRGDLYVTDSHTHSIRRITPRGRVETIAGNGTLGTATGVGGSARFNFPGGITVGPDGRLYVADTENHRICAIQLDFRAPEVVSQPVGTNLALGGSVSLTVVSSGTSDLTYQWRKGGAVIAGATNPGYALAGVQLSDAAAYDVVVTNAFGSVTSQVAVVTVNQGQVQGNLTNGLVAYYPFNGNANDESGNRNNGVVNGAALTQDRFGVTGRAYNFNGINQYIQVPAALSLDLSEFTLTAWTRLEINANSANEVLTKGGDLSENYELLVYQDGGWETSIRFVNGARSGINSDWNGERYTFGQWVMLTTVYSPSQARMQAFANGRLLVTVTNSLLPSANSEDLFIGKDPSAGRYMKGLIDDIRIYNRALSASEVTQLYNIEAVPPSVTAPVIITQPVNATASVGDGPTFSVLATGTGPLSYQWRKDTLNLGGATTATLALNNVQTNQAGNYSVVISNVGGSVTSSVVTLTVNRLGQSISFGVPGSKSFGDAPFAVSASASSGLAVSFSIVSGPATLSGATLTLTGVGTVVVRATQGGDATYTAAASVEQSFTVAKGSQTITFPPLANRVAGDAAFTVNATASSGLGVSFSIVSGPATLAGNTITLTGVGTVVVRAAQAGNASYNAAATVDQSFTVAKGSQTITFAALGTKTYGDGPFTVSGTASSGLTPSFSIVTGPATLSGNTITLTGAGTVVVRAAQAGNGNYNAAPPVERSFTVGAAVPFASRQLPNAYSPGGKFTVTLTVTPAAIVSVYAVEDAPPIGWTVGIISHSGALDSQNGKVKFGPFFDATARTLSYELTPPANATGIQTFAGVASANGVDTAIGGTTTLDRARRIPADNNPADDRITISEVTAYGTAWKTGAAWPIDPNPIPISYVTRAGALWKGGETYRFDATVASAPLWWVNTGGVVPAGVHPLSAVAGRHVAAAVVVPGEAAAELAGGFQLNRDFAMTLRVRPGGGVQAYAVEETVPPGWTVKAGSLDQGGSFDGTSRKVKWGPFFDTQARVFTVVLEPGSNPAPVVFAGVASFDGVDVAFSGRRAALRGSFLPENVNAGRNVRTEGFRVVLQGETGKRYDIEASETPAVPGSWVAVATNLDGAGVVDFTDLLATGRQARFYRVIER